MADGFYAQDKYQDKLADYHASDSDTADTTQYFGFLDKDGNWYILQNDTSAGTYRYFKGASEYAAAWTGRAALAYDYFDAIF